MMAMLFKCVDETRWYCNFCCDAVALTICLLVHSTSPYISCQNHAAAG